VSPGILTELHADHDAVRSLIGQVFATPGRRTVLYPKISAALRAHGPSEEKTLYQALAAYPQESSDIDRSYHEHHDLDGVLRELDATAYGDQDFMRFFEQMNEMLEHHLSLEETRVFAAAEQLIPPDERVRLGAQYRRLMRKHNPWNDTDPTRVENPCACDEPKGLVANIKRVLKNPTDNGKPRWRGLFGIAPLFTDDR
jgi:hypothetical protein